MGCIGVDQNTCTDTTTENKIHAGLAFRGFTILWERYLLVFCVCCSKYWCRVLWRERMRKSVCVRVWKCVRGRVRESVCVRENEYEKECERVWESESVWERKCVKKRVWKSVWESVCVYCREVWVRLSKPGRGIRIVREGVLNSSWEFEELRTEGETAEELAEAEAGEEHRGQVRASLLSRGEKFRLFWTSTGMLPSAGGHGWTFAFGKTSVASV